LDYADYTNQKNIFLLFLVKNGIPFPTGQLFCLLCPNKVFAKLDPGSTRWRGMLMQKLVPPWMEISKQDREAGSISVDVFKQRVFIGMLTAGGPVSQNLWRELILI